MRIESRAKYKHVHQSSMTIYHVLANTNNCAVVMTDACEQCR